MVREFVSHPKLFTCGRNVQEAANANMENLSLVGECDILIERGNMETTVTTPRSVSSKINQNGRIVIPAAIRRQMGLKAGDSLLMDVEDGVLRLETHRARIRRIQREFAQYNRPGVLASDELIAERREEARREEEEMERDRELYQARWQKAEKVA
jgi:AbrB family looped-hinge helix DNA binding protein